MPLDIKLLRPSHVLLAGFAAAIVFAASVVGWRVLNPLDTSWIEADTAQGYIGWLLLRHQDTPGWPLGFAYDLGAPLGKQVAYLDGSPLYVTMLWPFRSLLPDNFQYFGMFFLVHCILQFYFGYLISMQLMARNHLAALFGGLFFLTAPILVARTVTHFALGTHWLILAAFSVFFRSPPAAPLEAVAIGSLLAAVAGGINPYITYMVLLVIGAAHLRYVLAAPRQRRLQAGGVAIASMLVVTMAAAAAWILFGFIDLADPAAASGAGYDLYSMDLLSIVNPMSYPSLLLPRINVGAGQYEGYNYLGLGALGLGLGSVAANPQVLRQAFCLSALPAWVILLISLALALSTKATAGGVVMYELRLPEPVLALLNAFRASGRLFWPAFYLLMAAALYAAHAAFGRRIVGVLTLALLVQVLDIRPLLAGTRAKLEAAQSAVFTDHEPWQSLALHHRHLVIVPAWPCQPHMTPGGLQGFWIFGKLAGQRGMSINSFYSGRFSKRQAGYFCEKQPRQIEISGLREDTAYVFARRGNMIGINSARHFCRKVDGIILCSREPDTTEQDGLHWPPFRVGDTLQLSQGEDDRMGFDAGWHAPEGWGRWSAQSSRLSFTIQEPAKEIVLQAVPFVGGSIKSQRIRAAINGVALPEQAMTAEGELTLPIPAAIGGHAGEIVLQMQFPDARSLLALGLSRDPRVFALGARSITVR
ncbi:MAG TPA: DUF6311 domain-containing protein [Hyphomicrobiaceae bacterium]|nr:DUF6311 domain-containing protein [Hyphomicrobiaceae bacterium]